jgi:hypothetical protein
MSKHPHQATLPLLAAMISLTVAPSITWADGLKVAPVKDPLVAKECSACHMLYPAGLLVLALFVGFFFLPEVRNHPLDQ